ncbi:hypothetical protein, partial [Priestia megaterium]|uniref:hypothetical protein n=1 Tax=Priestia megaterium TaxID=1404 RepID=UPI002FFDA427
KNPPYKYRNKFIVVFYPNAEISIMFMAGIPIRRVGIKVNREGLTIFSFRLYFYIDITIVIKCNR